VKTILDLLIAFLVALPVVLLVDIVVGLLAGYRRPWPWLGRLFRRRLR
jgi:hypothetical protein